MAGSGSGSGGGAGGGGGGARAGGGGGGGGGGGTELERLGTFANASSDTKEALTGRPSKRGSHISTFKLNVSTFGGTRGVLSFNQCPTCRRDTVGNFSSSVTKNVSALSETWTSFNPCHQTCAPASMQPPPLLLCRKLERESKF